MRKTLTWLAAGTLCMLAAVSAAQNGRLFLDEAPLDKAVDFPQQALAEYFAKMNDEQIGVIRLLEGGLYNVNIRHVENTSPDNYRTEIHEDTVDVWVIREGSGTLVTGGERVDGKHQGGTERPIGVGVSGAPTATVSSRNTSSRLNTVSLRSLRSTSMRYGLGTSFTSVALIHPVDPLGRMGSRTFTQSPRCSSTRKTVCTG